jgi:hypothetical protein
MRIGDVSMKVTETTYHPVQTKALVRWGTREEIFEPTDNRSKYGMRIGSSIDVQSSRGTIR